MSLPIKISQLITMSVITTDDFMPIVDSGSNSTQRVTIEKLKSFFNTGGNYTGVFTGILVGTASWANNAVSSSYSLTSSYAEKAKNVEPGLYETINVDTGHWFKVGHVIRKTKLGESGGFNGYTTCSIDGDLSGSEAIGLITDSGSNNSSQSIRVCYQGLADFSNDLTTHLAPYLATPLQTGSVYFMSNGGSLTLTEPTDIGSITKPMLIALTTSSGIIINSRGIKVGSNLTTSSNAISAYQRAGGFGMITGSLSRPPAYLRCTLLCQTQDGTFNNLDELDLTSVFSTSSGTAPHSSPFMSLTTIPVSSFTASFKPTSSWGPQATGKLGSIQSIDIGKWKLKIYS